MEIADEIEISKERMPAMQSEGEIKAGIQQQRRRFTETCKLVRFPEDNCAPQQRLR